MWVKCSDLPFFIADVDACEHTATIYAPGLFSPHSWSQQSETLTEHL